MKPELLSRLLPAAFLVGAAALIGALVVVRVANSNSEAPREKYELLKTPLETANSEVSKVNYDPLKEAEEKRLEALEHPENVAPKYPAITAPPWTLAPWPQGLLQTGQSRWPAASYLFENAWQWDINGLHVQVYAGKAGSGDPDSGRGLVKISSTTFDLKSGEFGGEFRAPLGVGSLHIESYDGFVLRLESAEGDVFYLDIQNLVFMDESGEPVTYELPPKQYSPPATHSASGTTATPAPVPLQ